MSENRNRHIAGLTDKVTTRVEYGNSYPCLNILMDENVPRYKLQALSRLVKTGVSVDDDELEVEYDASQEVYVALKTERQYSVIGKVLPEQVKTLMSILIDTRLELELSKGVFKDPIYAYALSK